MATYRVLALDGGGIRGLVTAIMLRRICDSVPAFLDEVDLFAGTSSGGLIALSLAHGLGKRSKVDTLDEIIKVFEAGRDTFGRARPRLIGTLVFAKYGGSSRSATLRGLFGDTRLGDLANKVLIASFDLDNDGKNNQGRARPQRWEPKLFHNFPGDNTDSNEETWRVAMATSAAPVLFPSFDGYVDGGVYSNNPSMCALAQLLDERYRPMRDTDGTRRNPRLDEVVLLSVGSGASLKHMGKLAGGWAASLGLGAIPWAAPGLGDVVKLVTDGTVGIADYQCRQLLRQRYRRIDITFKPGIDIGLDSVKDLPLMRAMAHEWKPAEDDVTFINSVWERRQGVRMPSPTAAAAQPTTAEKIAAAFKAKVKERKEKEGLKTMPRGAHPRHHGLVTAEFIVAENIPGDLRHGLFAAPGPHPAFVRFSNAGTHPHDGDRDAHGMAIKVLGIAGDHLESDDPSAESVQDFLLTDFPAFIASTPEDFLDFMVARKALVDAAGKPEFKAMLDDFNRRFPNVERARNNIGNPLAVRYFSQTPYALGNPAAAVKYSTLPLESDTERPATEAEAMKRGNTYLRDAMVTRLSDPSRKPVEFQFQVQRRTAGMDLEDPTQIWSETDSQFVTVATVVIPTQPLQPDEFAEAISFNPWNGLKAHMPLGQVNGARRQVYPASALFRGALPANPARAASRGASTP